MNLLEFINYKFIIMKLKVIFENHKVDGNEYLIKGSVGIECTDYNRYNYGEPFKVIGKGVAKCNPSDAYDEKYGRSLAISRAYADAYRQIYNKIDEAANKVSNHYNQLLNKISDCIYFEERSIHRLIDGVDIHNSNKEDVNSKHSLFRIFNKK